MFVAGGVLGFLYYPLYYLLGIPWILVGILFASISMGLGEYKE